MQLHKSRTREKVVEHWNERQEFIGKLLQTMVLFKLSPDLNELVWELEQTPGIQEGYSRGA